MQTNNLQMIQNANSLATAIFQIDNLINLFKIYPPTSHHFLITQWNQTNKDLLPKGSSEVKGHYPIYEIKIRWGPQQDCIQQLQGKQCIFRKISLLREA